jgi:hypothetical protein
MDAIKIPDIKVGFYRLMHETRFLGFSNLVDRVNPGKAIDRPTMDKLWVECLEKYYLKWKPTTDISQSK